MNEWIERLRKSSENSRMISQWDFVSGKPSGNKVLQIPEGMTGRLGAGRVKFGVSKYNGMCP